jgi:hypothetical protein
MRDVQIACPCPGSPHPGGDTVSLLERLPTRSALAVRNRVALSGLGEGDGAELLGILTEGYVMFGVAAWTLVDAMGKPLPCTREEVRRLCDETDLGMELADPADELYARQVTLPLLRRGAASSQAGSTDGSTFPSSRETPLPRRSRRSSTTTSPTADTGTTT